MSWNRHDKGILVLLLIGLFSTGCAGITPYRAHPSLNDKAKQIKTVVILPPQMEAFQLSAGGAKEKIDEWGLIARQNVKNVITKELQSNSKFLLKPFPENPIPLELEANLEETQALFNAVSDSVVLHTYGTTDHRFHDKVSNFNYSLGSEVKELDSQADAFLFVRGIEHISTGGRNALMAGITILAALGGAYVFPQGGITYLTVALVDAQTGNILWFNHKMSPGGHDLRKPESASQIVKDLFKDFPLR